MITARLRAAGCVFAEDEALLLVTAAKSPAELDAMISRRAVGAPLEQVVGFAEFCGLRISVDPGIFVPRRRTESLAREAAALLSTWAGPAAVVVDLCCGSGAIGAAVTALSAPLGADLHASDIDPAAVRCARRNLAAFGGHVYQGDLFEPLPGSLRGRVAVLVANVPYVPTAELGLLPAEARLHEPRIALDGGADGLDLLRRVAGAAPAWLAPGGSLLSEASDRQLATAAEILSRHGLTPRVRGDGELGATVIIGTRDDAA